MVLERLGPLPGPHGERRFEFLTCLAGDGMYAVRRAACRAASAGDPVRLLLLVGWASTHGPDGEAARRRAAEAAGWFRHSLERYRLAPLAWDEEPRVREAYRRSLGEADDRACAEFHERHVLAVGGVAEIIPAWRYGVAVARVGDDRTIDRLLARASRIYRHRFTSGWSG